MTDEDDTIPTNLRTLRILEIVAEAAEPLTPSEINARLGLPKQTAHRLCNTLADEGFLAREGAGTRLRPGRRLRAMASGTLNGSHLHIARHQVLRKLSEAVGETVNFVVPEPKGMRYRDRVETGWALRIQLPIGSNVPFHCTASGKTFLASLPQAARERMVRTLSLEKLTPNTITDISALLDELAEIDAQGFAMDREEFMEGMIALAAPIHDRDGRYAASIAFHAPLLRLEVDAALAHRQTLLDAAMALSEYC
ncbi:MAG: IclR family transcriptional regulator [Pseudomonadota bacterium]